MPRACFFYTEVFILFSHLVLTKVLPVDGGHFFIDFNSMSMGLTASRNPRSLSGSYVAIPTAAKRHILLFLSLPSENWRQDRKLFVLLFLLPRSQ